MATAARRVREVRAARTRRGETAGDPHRQRFARVHTCSSFTLKLRAVRSADRHAKFLATWCFGASDGNETTPPPFNGREPSRHLPLSAARVRGWMGPGGSVCSLRPRQRQPGGLTRGLGASGTPLIRACAWWSHMSMASLTWSPGCVSGLGGKGTW